MTNPTKIDFFCRVPDHLKDSYPKPHENADTKIDYLRPHENADEPKLMPRCIIEDHCKKLQNEITRTLIHSIYYATFILNKQNITAKEIHNHKENAGNYYIHNAPFNTLVSMQTKEIMNAIKDKCGK